MQVKQFNGEFPWIGEVKKPTHEELQQEYNYLVAEKLAKSLLEASFITEKEYKLVMKRMLKLYRPLYASLMPDE